MKAHWLHDTLDRLEVAHSGHRAHPQVEIWETPSTLSFSGQEFRQVINRCLLVKHHSIEVRAKVVLSNLDSQS